MTAPLYFLPGLSKEQIAPGGRLNQALLAERGLAHVFGDRRGPQDDCAASGLSGRGPGGHSGVILCALPVGKDAPRRIGYYPAEQRWERGFALAEGKAVPAEVPPFYVGIDTAEPPGPEDLARSVRHKGYPVALGDGNQWEVPVILAPDGDTSLPRTFAWDPESGELCGTVRAEYRDAWEASADTIAFFYGDEDDNERPYEVILPRCLQALGLNYRLGPAEQNALGLIDTTNCTEILGATVDAPKVRKLIEAEKKKRAAADAPATPGSAKPSPGATNSSPATAPPAATS